VYPSHLRYTKEHEWIAVEGGSGVVGITDFAQHELGDIVYVELPEPGRKVKAGEVLGTIESVKAVSEIYSPVTGEVTEVNRGLADAPQTVNEDPHGTGWLCKIRLSDSGEVAALMDSESYSSFVNT
jgi:glycine cleavage system H protein